MIRLPEPAYDFRQTLEECKKMGEKILLDELNLMLFAHRISMQGNALSDEFGISFIAKNSEIVDVDLQEEAEKISKELEDLL